MNVATSVFAIVSADNPLVLLMGAGSVAIILAALYQGGWKYVTHYAVHTLVALYWLASLWAGLVAFFLFCSALFGAEEGRAGNFLGAVIITAAMLVIGRVLNRDNGFTRFLASLIISKEDKTN